MINAPQTSLWNSLAVCFAKINGWLSSTASVKQSKDPCLKDPVPSRRRSASNSGRINLCLFRKLVNDLSPVCAVLNDPQCWYSSIVSSFSSPSQVDSNLSTKPSPAQDVRRRCSRPQQKDIR